MCDLAQKGEYMVKKLVTVEVVRPYKDLEKSLLFYEKERHQVTEQRAAVLEEKGLAKRITETKEPE